MACKLLILLVFIKKCFVCFQCLAVEPLGDFAISINDLGAILGCLRHAKYIQKSKAYGDFGSADVIAI